LDAVVRIGALSPRHRDRVGGILRASELFREEEVEVALELFDSALDTASGAHDAIAPNTITPPVSSDYSFLGAFTPEDELTGFACYGPTPATDRTWDLYWIAVDPARQRTGSGTILLNEVERRLESLNARLVVVETSSRSDYAAARGFYLRHGYVEAARAREFYAPADDRITFTKRLQGRGSARRERTVHGASTQ
jgi:ribosomal protein S18 acetylase RimI-like enzyme